MLFNIIVIDKLSIYSDYTELGRVATTLDLKNSASLRVLTVVSAIPHLTPTLYRASLQCEFESTLFVCAAVSDFRCCSGLVRAELSLQAGSVAGRNSPASV